MPNAPRSRIAVNANPGADHYRSRRDEKIIEFSSPAGGGLIDFSIRDGHLDIEPYRTDETVRLVNRDKLSRILAEIDADLGLLGMSYDELAARIAREYEAGTR